MAAGMLTGLFDPKYSDLAREQNTDDERMLRVAAMDPFQQAGYAALQGSNMMGRGLGEAVAGATGLDARSPVKRNLDAIQAAKAQVSQLGFDPADPKSIDEFYKRVIQILQKQGLAAEALDVAREWHKQKNEDAQTAAKTDEVSRKRAKDLQTDARAQERNRILETKGALGAESIQLLNQIDEIDPLDPNGKFKKDAIVARLNQLSAGKGVKFMNLGDRVEVVDALTGKVLRTEDVGAKPLDEKAAAKQEQVDSKTAAAYAEAKAGYQKQYDAAVALYNSPGLSGITGRFGRLVGEEKDGQLTTAGHLATTAASGASRAALALWKQVTGATFLAGLAQLKAASPTGSTGLGAVSNAEGARVTAAAAALSREQDETDLRKQLAIYIQTLVESAGRLDAAANSDKVTPIPLQPKPLGGSQGVPPAAAPAARPAPAASPTAAPAAPGGPKETEFEWGPDGKLRRKK